MSSSVQGSVVVRRVRQGDTVTTRLDWDKALYQGITDGGALVNPDWTVEANQPTITPQITSSLKDGLLAIIPGSVVWKYNGVVLTFGGDNICNSVYGLGLFSLNATTGALKIIGNLASGTNTNVDKLRFDARVNTGYETEVGADVDVRIELVGKNSYTGVIDTTSKTLKETVTESITATARLTLGITSVSTFKTEWYKGQTIFKAKSSDKTCSIGRSDVSGSQIFTCNFYVTIDGVDKLVSTYLFVIYDSSDPYIADLVPTSNADVTDSTPSAEYKAILRRRVDFTEITAGVTWVFEAYNCRADLIVLTTAIGTLQDGHKTVTVTTTDTDRVEPGETEQNGDIAISATATL